MTDQVVCFVFQQCEELIPDVEIIHCLCTLNVHADLTQIFLRVILHINGAGVGMVFQMCYTI